MSDKLEGLNNRLPRHVAVIMDGNRRWAKSRGLFAINGHNQGVEAVKRLLQYVLDYKIEYITLFGFSSENWKRPNAEVAGLMKLLKKFIHQEIPLFQRENIRVCFIGQNNGLSQEIIDLFRDTEEKTKNNNKLFLNIAFNYGAHQEIIQAVKDIAFDLKEEKINITDITENLMDNYLLTRKLPPLDLLIRTSGEVRLSNFMLWQAAYSELVFQDVLWPDYSKDDFLEALQIYANRVRRFGGD
ncbi:MAG: polyprenyl diphosphate synthase [Alphaproteobacteria bacterium]